MACVERFLKILITYTHIFYVRTYLYTYTEENTHA